MAHRFTFFRAGGFDQVRLATAADIAAIGDLDRTLWAALACPVKGLELDERTLALVDGDGDGRVRAPEIVAAVQWTRERLVDLGSIIPGPSRLPLAAISPAAPNVEALLACARRVLAKAGKAGATDIGLDELGSAAGELAKTRFNGDGVLPAAAAEDPALSAAITDILSVRTPVPDRGGEPGIDRAGLAAFLADAAAWLAWWDAGQARAAELLPAGEATPAAFAAVEAVRAKVDDFMLRCRSAAFDPRAAAQLARGEADWAAIAGKDLGAAIADLAAFPIARVAAGAALPLDGGVNPAWSAAVSALRSQAVGPVLGDRTSLDEPGWLALCATLEPFRAWRTTEAAAAVGRLGPARLRALLAPEVKSGLEALFAQDEAVKPEFDALNDLERLVRYHRDLYRLLQNVVAMADFYDPVQPAVFQAGTLYFSGRAMELCVRVADLGRHGQLAARSNSTLLYCDCTRPGAAMTVCAAVTAGHSDGLFAGRNGMFVDRQGRDWDATVVKVVENPISIREAFWSPYKRLVRFVEDFITRRASEADKAADAKLGSAAASAAEAAQKGGAAAPKPKFDLGMLAALGVAVGGITTAMGLALNALFGLGWLMPLGILGVMLAISLPSMLIAWLKLRTRNLGPILDANGWAVNGNVRINIPFGRTLTRVGSLPPGSARVLGDPYAEGGQPWYVWLALVLVIAGAAWTGWERWHAGRWWWEAAPAVAPAPPVPTPEPAPAKP